MFCSVINCFKIIIFFDQTDNKHRQGISNNVQAAVHIIGVRFVLRLQLLYDLDICSKFSKFTFCGRFIFNRLCRGIIDFSPKLKTVLIRTCITLLSFNCILRFSVVPGKESKTLVYVYGIAD